MTRLRQIVLSLEGRVLLRLLKTGSLVLEKAGARVMEIEKQLRSPEPPPGPPPCDVDDVRDVDIYVPTMMRCEDPACRNCHPYRH